MPRQRIAVNLAWQTPSADLLMPAEMPVPPQVPLIKFVSPSKADQALVEFWSAEVASYTPLDLGASHPNTREYSGYKLGKQFNLPNDHRFIVRVYVTDETDPTWWNWAEKFSGDANSYPIFIREYREPRETYAPLTKGQPLKSVYKLALATAGTGYTPDTLPEISFSGGSGSGAAGHAVVNPDGTIAHLVLDDGGSGYTSAPTITIEAPPTGTTATGTAVVQPATALLVAEEAQQFPDDSEFRGLYLNVVRVYETLPGPYLPFTRYDDDLGPIQGRKRAVLYSNQVTTLGATSKKTYEARDGSSIVAWEIEESWSDGTGSAGNPVYPIGKTDFNDPDRGPIHQTSQITTDTTSPGSSTESGGIVTTIRYEPYQDNPDLRKKIIETWEVPRTLTDHETTTDFGGGTLSVERTRAEPGQTVDEGLLVVASAVKEVGDGTEQKITRTALDDWPTLLETEFDSRFGILINIAKTVVAAGTTGSAGPLTVTEVKALDKWRSIQIVGSLQELPDDQVWFGTRNHTFPDELIGFTLAGSTTVEVQFNIRDGYSGPCRARFTRSFTEGPPSAEPAPTIFRPQSYSQYLEYNASRTHTTVSEGTSSSEHSGTSQENSTSSGTTNRNDTSSSTNSGTSQSNHQSTEQGQSTTQQASVHSSSETSNVRHLSSTTSNGTSEGTEEGERHSTSQIDHSFDHSDDTSYTSSHSGTQRSASNTETTTTSSNVEGGGASSSTSTSNSTGAGSNTSQSATSGTSQNTTSSTSNQTSAGTSQHSSTSTGSNSSSGTSQQTSSSTGSVQTTAPSILQVNVPKTLRDALSLTNSELGITISIPATDPIALPHGEWIIVDSQSEHWRFGVWMTETIEILVP